MNQKHEIEKAESQLLGFKHGQSGYDLLSLVESMGLTKQEWKILKKDYALGYMSERDKERVDKFFGIKKKKK